MLRIFWGAGTRVDVSWLPAPGWRRAKTYTSANRRSPGTTFARTLHSIVASSLADLTAPEFGEGAEEMNQHLADRGGRVEARAGAQKCRLIRKGSWPNRSPAKKKACRLRA